MTLRVLTVTLGPSMVVSTANRRLATSGSVHRHRMLSKLLQQTTLIASNLRQFYRFEDPNQNGSEE